MAIVFQYGSNAESDRLNSINRLKGDARCIGMAYTDGDFELDFTTWSEGNQCAAADIVSGPGRKIWGVLYEVPDQLIKRETSGSRKSFDAVEGKNYQRVGINLRHPDGSPVTEHVITYVVKERQPNIRTSLDYVKHIIKGLRDNDAPDEYIEYVKKRATDNNPDLRPDIKEL